MATARERARKEVTAEIVEAAKKQLAEVGPQQLSLRAVARDVGMVSSAVYRYFPSRDDLLTTLIVEAYTALGEAVEHAEGAVRRGDFRARWRTACRAIRTWAVENPHEYALVYGSPVPGYRAPQATIEPASRVGLVLLGVVRDASAAGRLAASPTPAPSPELRSQLRKLGRQMAPELSHEVLANALMAWTQVFGTVSFELFGHYVGLVQPSGPFFEHTIEVTADLVGLPRRQVGGRA
jgi:AcrR family transcriptional regulator